MPPPPFSVAFVVHVLCQLTLRVWVLMFAVFAWRAVTFFNMVEIGVASEFKEVAVKHVDNGFFHPYAWVSASAIAHLPFAFANLWMFFT